jgi:hypothetical protein
VLVLAPFCSVSACEEIEEASAFVGAGEDGVGLNDQQERNYEKGTYALTSALILPGPLTGAFQDPICTGEEGSGSLGEPKVKFLKKFDIIANSLGS